MTHRYCAWAVAAVPALLLIGCSKSDDAASKPRSAPARVAVTTAPAELGDAPVLIRTIGSVQSKSGITVRPQVAGRVAQLPTPEGVEVRAGDVLVLLDARPYEASLAEAEANLARARALAADAHVLAERAREARASNAMTQRELEQAEAQAAAADAEVAAREALVQTARLDLAYCTVTAPFAGRLGQFLVKPGSIVKENDTDMVELAQIDPIEVAFAVPESSIAAVREGMAREPLRVEVLPSGENGPPVVGALTFIDNKVDAATGTIRLKATFANADHRLWPGRFTNVTLVIGNEPGSILVPESAVQQSQAGTSVFVVKADRTVELRPVSVRRVIDGRAVIADGVAAGESVVTDGQLRLAPGVGVEVRSARGKDAP
jgi:multidrug efflux system membrane fusion protein